MWDPVLTVRCAQLVEQATGEKIETGDSDWLAKIVRALESLIERRATK